MKLGTTVAALALIGAAVPAFAAEWTNAPHTLTAPKSASSSGLMRSSAPTSRSASLEAKSDAAPTAMVQPPKTTALKK